MSLKPLFKIFAAVVLFSTMFSEPTDTTYLHGIMNLVAISIFMQEDNK